MHCRQALELRVTVPSLVGADREVTMAGVGAKSRSIVVAAMAWDRVAEKATTVRRFRDSVAREVAVVVVMA